MKATVVVYGSSTGTCESIAQTIAEKLGVEAIDAANLSADTIKAHDNLLLGTSTWGAGELQDDWYDALKTIKAEGLEGKTVAVFGCGDCEAYCDTFCGGMKELHDAAEAAGARVIGSVDAAGYSYEDSRPSWMDASWGSPRRRQRGRQDRAAHRGLAGGDQAEPVGGQVL